MIFRGWGRMSNKSKTVKTDKATAQGRVPKLRFPGFRDARAWDEKPLGKVYSFKVTNSFSRDKLNYEKGLVKNIHYGDIHTRFSTLFDIRKEMVPFINSSEAISKIKSDSYCIEGDMVFADASEDLNDVGKSIEIVNLNNERLLSGLHTLLARQNNSELVIGFGGYLFKSNGIRTGIKKEAQGAKVLGVSAERLSNINIYFPTDKKEQQKIADCLASTDELITAQSQKIDTLKAHKKGLMQQLFPAQGETVPKLRFPEFRDAGAWEERTIQDLIDKRIIIGHLDGNHGALYPRAEEFSQVGVPYISANDFINGTVDFGKCKHIPMQRAAKFNKGVAKDGDILFAHNATVGPVAKLSTSLQFVILSTTATYFRCDNELLINIFLKYALSSPHFVHQYSRVMYQSTRNQVPITTQREFYLTLPTSTEQQKIAGCLSSIDELITAQAQKLDTLKTHKKGLMQQLFPSTDEANE